jgi:hypothetical protein
MFSPNEKEILLGIWQSLLDYSFALDSIKQFHSHYYKLQDLELQKQSFFVFYSAFLLQYRYLLEFIDMAEKNPAVKVILDEKNTEYYFKKNSYSSYKFKFLNVAIAIEFASLNTIDKTWAVKSATDLRNTINRHQEFIFKMGRGKGEKLTLKNAIEIIKNTGSKAFFPVQAGVSEWMGDVKVWRTYLFLITQEQIKDITAQLKPGDVLLERREWYLSNIGLPGYWPHTALYIGTPDERTQFFAGDDEFALWLNAFGIENGSFESLLQKQYPEKYAESVKQHEENHAPRVIEAMSEGVCFTTIEHSAACDSLAVLRPRLSKKEIGRAILDAFKYQGRPYDFNFDFLTDNEIVCSELIYKIYQPAKEYKGLDIPVINLLGRLLTPPNIITKYFDKTFGTESQQMDFVLFYDGYENQQKAKPSDVNSFRESWKRPKWYIFTQK